MRLHTFKVFKNRVGTPKKPQILACRDPDDIIAQLHAPAELATLDRLRVHYEWIWDGNQIWIVQSDREQPLPCESPRDLAFLGMEIPALETLQTLTPVDANSRWIKLIVGTPKSENPGSFVRGFFLRLGFGQLF